MRPFPSLHHPFLPLPRRPEPPEDVQWHSGTHSQAANALIGATSGACKARRVAGVAEPTGVYTGAAREAGAGPESLGLELLLE